MRTTLTELRELLRKLDGRSADDLESESLEFKLWDRDPQRLKAQLRELREAVVCLANARGGTVVLGIHDQQRSRKAAIVGVGDLDQNLIRKAVYDGTDPHILVDCEELLEPEGRLLVLHVPQGLGLHTTSEGVAKIRVGKQCQPLTGSMLVQRLSAGTAFDRTAQPLAGASMADLDTAAVRELQRLVATEGGKPELARLPQPEFLEGLGLVRDRGVTLAALLLVGQDRALARWVPNHEVVFLHYKTRTRYEHRRNLKGPILLLLPVLQELFQARLGLMTVPTEGFREMSVPALSWWAAREAVLNALVHRDYFLHQSVYVEIRPGRVEVLSPGGFVGGVTPQNVLRHPPVRRNPLLAEILEFSGLVNRAGMGVDRIYEELLRGGKGLPRYETDEASVRLILPTESHEAFARFVAEETGRGKVLDLDDLILLRAVTDLGHVDRWQAAAHLQASEEEAAGKLIALRERGYLSPRGRGRGTTYFLSRSYSDRLRGTTATDDSFVLDQEAVRLRILKVLEERGKLTNADIRRMSGYTRNEVVRLMAVMRGEGQVELVGRGRAAHYISVQGSKRKRRSGNPGQRGRGKRG